MADDRNKDDNAKAQMRTRFEWLYGFTENSPERSKFCSV